MLVDRLTSFVICAVGRGEVLAGLPKPKTGKRLMP